MATVVEDFAGAQFETLLVQDVGNVIDRTGHAEFFQFPGNAGRPIAGFERGIGIHHLIFHVLASQRSCAHRAPQSQR